MSLEPEYTLRETAEIVGMSERWVRQKIKDGAEHQRYGHKIKFLESQIAKLRASHTQAARVDAITTGRKKRTS